MLDLQKYLKRAAADPGFKAKLLKNANQAIKDEFGEDLPYELKCKEKLVFEVEPMDGLSDAELSNVAGGMSLIPLEEWEDNTTSGGFTLSTQIMSKRTGTGLYKYYTNDGGVRHNYSVKLFNLDGEWYVDPSTAR